MKNHLNILLGIGIVTTANLIGHFFAPFSLMTSFIYINLIIGIVNINLYKQNFNLTIFYNFILLITNDLLIRLYAGGRHDNQGMAWCWLMFYIGFIIAVIIMISYSVTLNRENKKSKTLNLYVIILGTVLTTIFYELVNSKI